MATIEFRQASPADATTIAQLHALSWQSTYRGIFTDRYLDGPVFADRHQHWHSRLHAQPAPYVLLAHSQGIPSGFVCVVLDADPHWGALIDNLHVHPNAKGSGLGRHLLHRAFEWIERQRPGSAAHLWVYEQNKTARGFYEHLGGTRNEQVMETFTDGSTALALRYVWPEPGRLITSV